MEVKEKELGPAQLFLSQPFDVDKIYELTVSIGNTSWFGLGIFRADFRQYDANESRLMGWASADGSSVNGTGAFGNAQPSHPKISWVANATYHIRMEMPVERLAIWDQGGNELGSWRIPGVAAGQVCFGARLSDVSNSVQIVNSSV